MENHGKNKLPKETNQGESTSSDTSVKPADAPVVNDASSGVVSQGSEGKKSKKKKVLAETNENIQGNTDGGK